MADNENESIKNKLENGLKEIFPRADAIHLRTVDRTNSAYWIEIRFKLGRLSSSFDYLDLNNVDELAKSLRLKRDRLYCHADMEIVKCDSGTIVDGYSQLTISFKYWYYEDLEEEDEQEGIVTPFAIIGDEDNRPIEEVVKEFNETVEEVTKKKKNKQTSEDRSLEGWGRIIMKEKPERTA